MSDERCDVDFCTGDCLGCDRPARRSPPQRSGPIRQFETGATRDTDTGKFAYEGFLSPIVLRRYAEYMHGHREQSDGTLRAGDNWQKGIPLEAYMDSGWRHFMDWWLLHRGYDAEVDLEEALCALIFNAMGYLHEILGKVQTSDVVQRVGEYTPEGPDFDAEREGWR